MTNLTSMRGPGDITFETQTADLTCTNALSKGDAVLLTLTSGGYTACTKSATANTTPGLLIGIALEDVTAGAIGHIGLKGVFEAACEDSMDAAVAGRVSGATAGRLEAHATNPIDEGTAYIKMVAISLEATATSGDLTSVLFDGINGFAAQSN
jgi:predicted RecA/RadA family phage recombinase